MTEELKTAIGLMSGTSMDGIDIALLKTDGEGRVERGPSLGIAYPPDFRKLLARTLDTATKIEKRTERPENMGEIERDLTLRHAAAVKDFLKRFKLSYQDIDYIGFHGQTVLHRPLHGLTVRAGTQWAALRALAPESTTPLDAEVCGVAGLPAVRWNADGVAVQT